MPNPSQPIKKATAEDHTIQMLVRLKQANTIAKRQAAATERIADCLERTGTGTEKVDASGEPKLTTAQIRAARRQELLDIAVSAGVREWAE